MENFADRRIDLRTAVGLLVIILLILGALSVAFLSYQRVRQTAITNPGTINTKNVAEETEVVGLLPSLASISSLIKPCQFVFYHSCAKVVTVGDNPVPTDKEYANTVEEDLFAAISKQPGAQINTSTVPLNKTQVAELFSEYVKDSQTKQVQVPVVAVLHRIAAKYNISPRVFLLLMEILNHGSGPLFSTNFDLAQAFFPKKLTSSLTPTPESGFVAQSLVVAEELKAIQTKYELMKKLPTELTFFDKKYPLQTGINVESLVLAEFLANHSSSKLAWERSIYPVTAEQSAPPIQAQNFILLYQMIFGVDPR